MQETKTEPYNQDIDMEIKEERRKVVDNRRTVMQQLGIREDHPHFLQIKDELEKLPIDWQLLFYPKIKEQCDIYDDEFREFTKGARLNQKLLELKNKRKKRQENQ